MRVEGTGSNGLVVQQVGPSNSCMCPRMHMNPQVYLWYYESLSPLLPPHRHLLLSSFRLQSSFLLLSSSSSPLLSSFCRVLFSLLSSVQRWLSVRVHQYSCPNMTLKIWLSVKIWPLKIFFSSKQVKIDFFHFIFANWVIWNKQTKKSKKISASKCQNMSPNKNRELDGPNVI